MSCSALDLHTCTCTHVAHWDYPWVTASREYLDPTASGCLWAAGPEAAADWAAACRRRGVASPWRSCAVTAHCSSSCQSTITNMTYTYTCTCWAFEKKSSDFACCLVPAQQQMGAAEDWFKKIADAHSQKRAHCAKYIADRRPQNYLHVHTCTCTQYQH